MNLVLPKKPFNSMAEQTTNIDWNNLSPINPEIMQYQATINIGTIGHVAHGKSTVVKAISGVQTVRFKNELERNITIKLGYANAKIYKCDNPDCPAPDCYASFSSDTEPHPICKRPGCGSTMSLLRHVSFVDCPGHDVLMATMLNGAAVMDAALLLIAGNEPCPQPQTSEHLAAVEIMKLQNLIILQNKLDLIKKEQAMVQFDTIRNFVSGTVAEKAPIIPISAQLKYNIDVVCEYIVKAIPLPIRDYTSAPHMIIIRSFDVNKPGQKADELKGGVAGGSILKGVLQLGDEIEIRPGLVGKDAQGNLKYLQLGHIKDRCTPILAHVESLHAEKNLLRYAVPGGLIGVGTKIDPTLTRADRLVGQVLGHKDKLPNVFTEISINFYLLKRLLGVNEQESDGKAKVKKLSKGEVLMVNIGSTSTGGTVVSVKGESAKLTLTKPVCTQEGEKIALSRRISNHWRLIGWGQIVH